MSDKPADQIENFDPLSILNDEEKIRYNAVKDDPKFLQAMGDINLITKIEKARLKHIEPKPEEPTKEGMFDWMFGAEK